MIPAIGSTQGHPPVFSQKWAAPGIVLGRGRLSDDAAKIISPSCGGVRTHIGRGSSTARGRRGPSPDNSKSDWSSCQTGIPYGGAAAPPLSPAYPRARLGRQCDVRGRPRWKSIRDLDHHFRLTRDSSSGEPNRVEPGGGMRSGILRMASGFNLSKSCRSWFGSCRCRHDLRRPARPKT
jgi:hypothetical protein